MKLNKKIKRLIYNTFFKKGKRRRGSRKHSVKSQTVATAPKCNAAAQRGKYDITGLREQVSKTEYISNLRIGRSWILPQLVHMGFKPKILGQPKFDVNYLEKMIRLRYNVSRHGRIRVWKLMKRNYKVIADTKGDVKRTRWWTHQVLKDVIKWDMDVTGHCDREVELLVADERTDSAWCYQLVSLYNSNRKTADSIPPLSRELPDSFIDAYMGDGAYYAMMTMVKVLGIRLCDSAGRTLTRDECIQAIDGHAADMNGRELMWFCKETFFDSGVFEYRKYMNMT